MATGKALGKIEDVAGTADGTYSANEVELINDLRDTVNLLLARMRKRGWVDQ